MPTIRGVSGPYRLYFYSFDCNEPMHIHAERDRMKCKFWMGPIMLASNDGFSPRELNRVRGVIQAYTDSIRRAWDEHCPEG
ncbi:DUF4160 domain-containing protein [Longimicrobium sp.]|uniref:DUF4160 domain-containing protein n=1 Tax=Longimicrobium sp. TaxID=2029185 RepID=UPI0039C99935